MKWYALIVVRSMSLDPKKNKIISQVGDNLEKVFDPEMPSVSVMALGLIYDISMSDDDVVNIKHTLTSPACPMADQIQQDIKNAGLKVEGVKDCTVELTFDPPFGLHMVPEETKFIMGW